MLDLRIVAPAAVVVGYVGIVPNIGFVVPGHRGRPR